ADDYFVFIPDSNTAPGGPLEQLVSSTGAGNAFEPAPDPDTNTDNDDSGTRDVPNGGFASQAVTLSANSEPGSEDPTLSGTPGFDGTLVNGQPHDDADSNLTVDFGFTPSMTLGSVVFQDNDDNGVQDTTDPGIENATVQLFDDAGNEIPVGPDGILGTADDAPGGVTSNATGEYNFSGLASGNYVVRVTPPAAYAPSADQIADPNTDINLDSNIDTNRTPPAGSYESGVVTLTPTTEPSGALENDPDGVVEVDPSGTQDNNANLTIDFGFVLPVSIGSYIWEDSNINGIQDPGESAIVAATVELLDENGDPVTDLAGNLVAAVPSSATGEYFFDNLPPGQYKVRVTPLDPSFVPSPAQTAAGDVDTENDSNINGAAIVPAGTFESGVFTLTPGSEPIEGAGVGDDQDDAAIAADDAGNMTVDFGFYRPVSLGSTLWEDTDASGTQDAGEPAIVAAEVTLLNADGTLYDSDPVAPGIQSLTDITDADGQYNFNAIPEGDYRVQVDLSTATNANAAVLVATPAQVADPDAVGPGQDNNTDSNIDTGAPGHNPAAQIYQSGVVTLAAGTEPSGETDPIGAGGADQPNQGLVPANQPDSSGNMTVDFGFIEGVSLGSTVWLDSNADGTQDAAEPAIVGATVTLLNADGTVYDSDPVTPGIQAVTDTTDAEGQYNFNGIPEGDYRVQVDLSTTTSQPAGSLIPTASQVADPDAAGDDNTDTNIDVAFDTDTSDDIYTSGVVSLSIGGEPVGETDPIGAGGADQPGQSAA
ncbi:MAG: hypothetical protein KAG66_01460, partial [Methylococcales bacterium]|nr:hypothetical protein [Methylococcales bacterium]